MKGREGFHWKRGRWRPSARQRQVLDALLDEKTNSEIARTLGISVAGVRWQISEMLGETGAEDRLTLAAWWRREREAEQQNRVVLPLFASLSRLKTLAAAGAGLTVVFASVLFLFVGASGLENDLDLQPAGLDEGRFEEPSRAERTENDVSAPDSIVVQWKRWEEWDGGGGAWSGEVLRIGVQNPPEPLAFGPGTLPLVSPNGQMVAHSDLSTGEVTVFDLATWQRRLRTQTAPQLFLRGWSQDSTQVYGWREYCGQPAERGACLEVITRDFWRIDLSSGEGRRLFVFDFSVIDLAVPLEKDAKRAYALGANTDVCCGINPQGDPFIAVLDLEDGRLIETIELPGLRAGQFEDDASFYPALALSPNGARLYIIDASQDAVIVLDTLTLEVERLEIHEKRSALARFGSMMKPQLFSRAEAKGGVSYRRHASITPDGRYLVIGGTSSQEVTGRDGSPSMKDRPSGVLVVNTADMTIALREREATWFELSPDGHRLLTYGSYYDETLGEDPQGGGLVAYGLKVFDLAGMTEMLHLWPGEEVWQPVFAPDGSQVFVTSEGPGMKAARRTGIGCSEDCARLSLLELRTGTIVWRGEIGKNQTILAFPP